MSELFWLEKVKIHFCVQTILIWLVFLFYFMDSFPRNSARQNPKRKRVWEISWDESIERSLKKKNNKNKYKQTDFSIFLIYTSIDTRWLIFLFIFLKTR